MKPDEMIGTVELMRAGGSPWSHVAKAIGSSSGPAAMKRYQRAKKVGPYSKPRSRKPRLGDPPVSPNGRIVRALEAGIDELDGQRVRLEDALAIVEGKR